jgi:endonuclease VIII
VPEGDVVWRAARRLDQALTGGVLIHTDFRVPRLATSDLTGRTVRSVASRGKHLLIRLGGPPGNRPPGRADGADGSADGSPDGGLTVHTHLRMEGWWRIRRTGPAPPPPDPDIRLVLATGEWLALGYRRGVGELLRTRDEERRLAHLGPDLLGPDWDPAEAVRRLREHPERAIGTALLDQTRLAGIGNLYKAEVLFLRGVDPWRPLGEVPALEELVALAHRLMTANLAADRAGQVTTGVRRRGEETWVYGRAGRPCRRCGTPIRRRDQGDEPYERVTFWCPACQPARAPARRAGSAAPPASDHVAEGEQHTAREDQRAHDVDLRGSANPGRAPDPQRERDGAARREVGDDEVVDRQRQRE